MTLAHRRNENGALRLKRPKLKNTLGQPSWEFRSSLVRASLTRLGGHLAPVTFTLNVRGGGQAASRRGKRPAASVRPFAIAPWTIAKQKFANDAPGLLRSLRGDFFCCPFGANTTPFRGERHPPHGETANSRWSLVGLHRENGSGSAGKAHRAVTLHCRLSTAVRRGIIDKYLTLVDGHTAIYSSHRISGMAGPMSLGHHALLQFAGTPGSGFVSTSRFVHGQVLPTPFENPEEGGYQCLRAGAAFRKLERVPLAAAGRDGRRYVDLSAFPAREGFDDLVMLTSHARSAFAWNAVTFAAQGYVWFSLRDPRVLGHTILWMSNGGRHYAPWNGRHRAVMGIEDVTAYFHYGLAESARRNPLSRQGVPTTVELDAQRPTSINYIIGVAAIPRGFDKVSRIERTAAGVDLVSSNGRHARSLVNLDFLKRGSFG
jgi:hypothetical protein